MLQFRLHPPPALIGLPHFLASHAVPALSLACLTMTFSAVPATGSGHSPAPRAKPALMGVFSPSTRHPQAP